MEGVRPRHVFQFEPWQYDYVFSRAPYPCMGSAWATGKTLSLIKRVMFYSQEIPDNLGVIFRKEFTDLRDSTCIDFENYTGRNINSSRNTDLPNGSRIMFRHLEELNNLQNINLGWFAFEQADEIANDKPFFFLFGRLRRRVRPSEYFKKVGWPLHSGFIICNAGENWVRQIWKPKDQSQVNPKFPLFEATTFDNAHNLSPDFLEGLEEMRKKKPNLYARYVLNDWEAEVEGKLFFHVRDRISGTGWVDPQPGLHYTIGVDLARKEDFTVITVLNREQNHVDYVYRSQQRSWNEVKAQIKAISKKYNHGLVVPDATGVGDPIVEDLVRDGVPVYHHHKTRDSDNEVPGVQFTNANKENMIERLKVAIEQGLITYPFFEPLIFELEDFEAVMLPSRRYRYQAPEGRHDDCVISLALALWGVDWEHYDAYTPPPPKTPGREFWDRVDRDRRLFKRREPGAEREIDLEDEGREIDL